MLSFTFPAVDSQPSVDRHIYIDRKLVGSRPIVDRDVDGNVERVYRRVSIDTRPQMPSGHMIMDLPYISRSLSKARSSMSKTLTPALARVKGVQRHHDFAYL